MSNTPVLNENSPIGSVYDLIRANEFLKDSSNINDNDLELATKLAMLELKGKLKKPPEYLYNESYYSDEERVLVAAYVGYRLFIEKVVFKSQAGGEPGEEDEAEFAVKRLKADVTEIEFDTDVSAKKFSLTSEQIEDRLKKKVCIAAKVLKIVLPDICGLPPKKSTYVGVVYGG